MAHCGLQAMWRMSGGLKFEVFGLPMIVVVSNVVFRCYDTVRISCVRIPGGW